MNGAELPSPSRPSNIESGLGNGTKVTVSRPGNHIVITESVTDWYGTGALYHYLVAQNGVNNISPSQIKNRTLRIGITAAYGAGRPQDQHQLVDIRATSGLRPTAVAQYDHRHLPRQQRLFVYDVPASAFVVGTNRMTIHVVSGEADPDISAPASATTASKSTDSSKEGFA